MTVGARIRQRLTDLSMSQSELARRVGINQSTVAALLAGRSRSSSHLHLISRALETSTAYLVGEIDDPSENAPVPRPQPVVQHITMQVALPSENALAEMYAGQLRAFARLEGDELARALAKRLPKALARLQAAELYELSGQPHADHADAEPQVPDHREPQQVRRT